MLGLISFLEKKKNKERKKSSIFKILTNPFRFDHISYKLLIINSISSMILLSELFKSLSSG